MKKSTIILLVAVVVGVTFILIAMQYLLPSSKQSKLEPTPTATVSVTPTPSVSSIPENMQEITLYFADDNAMYLIAEKRLVQKQEGKKLETIIVEELIKGTKAEGLHPVFNPNTKVISTSIKGGVCQINFAKGFLEKNTGGTAREMLLLDSIANTLTEVKGVTGVTFRVENEPITEFGEFVLTEPLNRRQEVIKKIIK